MLLWGSALVVVAAILLFGIALKDGIHAEEQARLEQESRVVNDALVEHTNQLVNQVHALLNGVRHFYLRDGSLSDVDAFIDALGFDKSVIGNIYVIDAQGVIVVSHTPDAQPGKVDDREYFQVQRAADDDKPFISSVEKGDVTGDYHFRISRRINKPDGSFGGLVLATIEPQSFTRHYQQLSSAPGRVATLIGTRDRKIRARFPEPAPEQWQTPLESQLWAHFAQATSSTYQARSAVDGVERTYVYKQVGDLPLVMVHGFSQPEVEQNANARFMQIAIWGIALIFFILMLSLTFSLIFSSRDRLERAYRQLTRLNQKIRTQAMLDSLTGLPNRPMFFGRLSKELSQARRNNRQVALLFIDLDGFKQVNDQFGHDAGDVVLKTAAMRWLRIVRESDTVARLGGDEFAVIIGDLEDTAQALRVAEKLIEAMLPAIQLSDERHCQVGCSIGISIYPTSATEIDSLLRAADAAMYQSKSCGKNSLTVSDASPDPNHAEWLSFNSTLLVGFAEMDEQHRQLVRRVNEINQAIIDNTPAADIDSLFKELIEFIIFHFATEHRLMVQYQYPDQAAHDHEHQILLDEAGRLTSEFSRGNELLVLQTIKDWLLEHIKDVDKLLGAFLTQKAASDLHSEPSPPV